MHTVLWFVLQEGPDSQVGFFLFVGVMVAAIAAMIWLTVTDPEKKDRK